MLSVRSLNPETAGIKDDLLISFTRLEFLNSYLIQVTRLHEVIQILLNSDTEPHSVIGQNLQLLEPILVKNIELLAGQMLPIGLHDAPWFSRQR
jgi:hypothetical protein